MVLIVPVTGQDPAQTALFAAWNDVFTGEQRAGFGPQEQGWTLEERRRQESSPYDDTVWLAARDDAGAVVAAAEVTMPREDNRHLAHGRLAVRPGAVVGDIGPAVLRAVVERVRQAGRRVLLVETEWPVGASDTVGEGLLARNGFEAAQTVLRSEMPLPADTDRLAALAAGESAAYALETVLDGMPDAWVADRARLQARMSTDTPLGDVDLHPEEWTEERMRDWVEQTLASGRRYVETVAREVAGGMLVGFTTITVSDGDPTLAYQWDTLVLREHRGHRLGLRLKAANALALERAVPTVTRIRTWNAEDNAHMLAVNTALGYRRAGFLREWQLRLGPS